jgi:hypothetical protein
MDYPACGGCLSRHSPEWLSSHESLSKKQMPEKPYVDIGFIIPLREEFEGLEKIFSRLEQYVEGVQFSTKIDLGVHGLSAVAYLQDDMGKSASGRAADRLLAKYEVGIIIVLGIAGGLSSDVSIGDVCFSGTIIDVVENAKVSDDKKGQKVKYTPKFLPTDPRLSFALKYVKLGTDTRPSFEHVGLGLIPCSVHFAGCSLGLERREEALHRRIVPDVA